MSFRVTNKLSLTVLDQANRRPPVRWPASKQKESITQQPCWVALKNGSAKGFPLRRSKGEEPGAKSQEPRASALSSLPLCPLPFVLCPKSPVVLPERATELPRAPLEHKAPDTARFLPLARPQIPTQHFHRTTNCEQLCQSRLGQH